MAPVSFSPEGHVAIHVLNKDTTWDIEVIRSEDGKFAAPEPFASSSSLDIFPEFSPDGKWIAYTANDSGQYQIYVRPYPGPSRPPPQNPRRATRLKSKAASARSNRRCGVLTAAVSHGLSGNGSADAVGSNHL